jgi:hypothetical protein
MSRNYNNPDSVNYKLAYLKEQIGDAEFGKLAYADQVQLAMLGETIIIGGFLRTELIKAKSIFSSHLNVDDYVKLEGTGLKIEDELGFLRAHHGQPAPGQFGSRWNHADGSYTRADAEGLLRYVAGANKSYHYLMHVGTGSITASNWDNEMVITLPPEFKNKDFRVFAMISGYSGPDKNVMFSDLLVQSGIKSQANGTMWVKGASGGCVLEGVFGAIDYLGESRFGYWFRLFEGAMYSVTLNFTYFAIA